MPSPADVILASLGLQGSLLQQANRQKFLQGRAELESVKGLGKSVGATVARVGQDIHKHKAEQEVQELESLFATSMADKDPDKFVEIAAGLNFNTPEAAQARNQMMLKARQMRMQDKADQRSDIMFGFREAEHELAQTQGAAALRSAEIRDLSLLGQVDDREDNKRRVAELDAQNAEMFSVRMDTLRAQNDSARVQLATTNEGRAVLSYLNVSTGRADRLMDAIIQENERPLDAFARAERHGQLDKIFPSDDPLAVMAKREYEKELRAEEAQNVAIDKQLEAHRRSVIQTNIIDAEANFGGEAAEKGKAAVMGVIKGMKFDSPSDFAMAYDKSYEAFSRYLDIAHPEQGIKRSVVQQIGIAAIGETLDKGLLRALGQNGHMSPRLAMALISNRQKFVDNYVEARTEGLGLTSEGGDDAQDLRNEANNKYMEQFGALATGQISPEQLGIDETALPAVAGYQYDPDASFKIIQALNEREKARDSAR